MVTAYALAFGSLLLLGGRLGDMFSRKAVFITGLIGFAVASALVNTMQQVGGSIGTAALSTFALTATARYLVARPAPSAAVAAAAATHGYTLAFAISAALFGLGVLLALVLLPSKRRLAQLRVAAAAPPAAATTQAATTAIGRTTA